MNEPLIPPPALVLGCNTPHGINVLSDWIEEQTGHAPDFVDTGWSDFDRSEYGDGYGPGLGYGQFHRRGEDRLGGNGNGDGHLYGYGHALGADRRYSNGNGSGDGDRFGDRYVDGDGRGSGYGSDDGDGRSFGADDRYR